MVSDGGYVGLPIGVAVAVAIMPILVISSVLRVLRWMKRNEPSADLEECSTSFTRFRTDEPEIQEVPQSRRVSRDMSGKLILELE
jgi:hypothetical protein